MRGKCTSCGIDLEVINKAKMFDMLVDDTKSIASAWLLVSKALKHKIYAELKNKANEAEKSIWYLDASDGDMSEFGTMLNVIEAILEVDTNSWNTVIANIEQEVKNV